MPRVRRAATTRLANSIRRRPDSSRAVPSESHRVASSTTIGFNDITEARTLCPTSEDAGAGVRSSACLG